MIGVGRRAGLRRRASARRPHPRAAPPRRCGGRCRRPAAGARRAAGRRDRSRRDARRGARGTESAPPGPTGRPGMNPSVSSSSARLRSGRLGIRADRMKALEGQLRGDLGVVGDQRLVGRLDDPELVRRGPRGRRTPTLSSGSDGLRSRARRAGLPRSRAPRCRPRATRSGAPCRRRRGRAAPPGTRRM